MTNSCIIRSLVHEHSLIDAYPDCSSERSVETEDNGVTFGSFARKEDQDVFVFKQIMKRLPPSALLHLLGKGDSSSNTPTPHDGSKTKPTSYAYPTSAPSRTGGKVRFALDREGEVKVKIDLFEKAGNPKLWWSSKDLRKSREECHDVVVRYLAPPSNKKQSHETYVYTMAAELNRHVSDTKSDVSSRFVRLLSKHYEARGLERQILEQARRLSQHHVETVLAEANYDSANRDEALRQASLMTSRPGVVFARELAACDRLAVLQELKPHELNYYTGKTQVELVSVPGLTPQRGSGLRPTNSCSNSTLATVDSTDDESPVRTTESRESRRASMSRTLSWCPSRSLAGRGESRWWGGTGSKGSMSKDNTHEDSINNSRSKVVDVPEKSSSTLNTQPPRRPARFSMRSRARSLRWSSSDNSQKPLGDGERVRRIFCDS